MTKFLDTLIIDGTRIRDDGYLVADARVARTGIQLYAGWEVGKPDKAVVRVYRPADSVFDKQSMQSFASRPVTNDHPDVAVTADNWKEFSVGQTSEEIARDGEWLRIPLMVSDAAAIKAVQDGKNQLSAGYSAELIFGDGVTPEGEKYDAIQTNIRANHVAIVRNARAGKEARIGDDGKYVSPILDNRNETKDTKVMSENLRKIMVDGLQVETTEAGESAIRKLTADRDAAVKARDEAVAANDAALAAKDAEIAKKDAEIEKLKSEQLDADALDSRVAARSELLANAKAIAPNVETKGMSDAAIRKAVVVAKLGDAAVKDKSDAYIDARFDVLVEDASGNEQVRYAVAGAHSAAVTKDAKAQETEAFNKSITDMNAWRNKAS